MRMKPELFLQIMDRAEQLKNNPRHSWTSSGRRESVAEHSWRLALMAYFVKDEFPQADLEKLLAMCLLHDMGEAFTGDIPAFEKSPEDERREEAGLAAWVRDLPAPYCGELTALFEEMQALESLEARLCKALDKLEALIQHNEADISTWLPLEYELQLTYGQRETRFSPYLRRLMEEVNRDSIRKIRENDAPKEDG